MRDFTEQITSASDLCDDVDLLDEHINIVKENTETRPV
jgi:hypothetical protein